MKRTLLFLFTLICFIANAQDFSNKGKDFWLTYPAHIDVTNSVMGIYITSDANTSGQIKVGTSVINFTVVANQITKKFLGTTSGVDGSNTQVYLDMADGIKPGAAIHITSLKGVVVYAHIIRSARSGATLVLPTPVLGTEYLVPSYQSAGSSGGTEDPGIGQVSVVATQPNTLIEITPTVNGRGGRPANTPFQVTLANAGDCYQFQGQRNADISGTTVKSIASGGACKPIAVFSSTTWSAFDCDGASGGDNLFQQLFPLKSWGKKFITSPFINRPFDIYRIYVQNTSTVVKLTENGVTSTLGLADYLPSKKCYELKKPNPVYIEATEPISVVQYISSQTCKSGCTTGSSNPACLADPEMVILNPIEQTLNSITFFSAHQNYVPPNQTQVSQHYVNVIIPKNHKSSLLINNTAPTATFIDIPGTNFSYIQENLTQRSASNPVHRITADTGFTAIVYGYGNVESYGYNGGTNIKDQYQFTTVSNPFGNIDFPATCKETPFKLALTLPYKPTKLHWLFNSNPDLTPNADVINNAPVFDSSYVKDGRTLYVYKLPAVYKFKATGTFPVNINAFNPSPDGCSGEQDLNFDVEVYERPRSDFNINNTGCLTSPVGFTDNSTAFDRTINKWMWNFGDAQTSIEKNPNHIYASAGNYTIALRSISDIGCYADTSKSIVIYAQGVAHFSVSQPLCEARDITFKDSSTIASGSAIKKWYWDFGDGTKDTTLTPVSRTHVYATAGNYTATLYVENNSGCKSNAFSLPLVIGHLPQVNFILPEVCLADASASFKDSSTIADGTENQFSYLWNFGDGNATPANPNTSTNKNPSHKYSAVGVYNVALSVKSKVGCVVTTTRSFTVNGSIPVASFSIVNSGNICSKSPVIIRNNSTVDFGSVTKVVITWDSNNSSFVEVDDSPRPGKTYSHNYGAFNSPSSKTFTITFKAYSGQSCVNETSKQVTLYPNPQLTFNSLQPICSNAAPVLVSQGSQTGTIIPGTYTYSGNGVSPDGMFNPLAAGAGVHNVYYIFTSDKGCVDSAWGSITVYKAPMVDAGPTLYVLEEGKVQLQATASAGIIKWTPPTFLNSDTILQPTVTEPYTDMRYTLKITNEKGCVNKDTVSVKVLYKLGIPTAFSPNGDGINDKWVIEHLSEYPGCKIEVYNRAGYMIYNNIGYQQPWDGRFNGKLQPIGVYYYIIDPKNGRKPVAGYVTIVM